MMVPPFWTGLILGALIVLVVLLLRPGLVN